MSKGRKIIRVIGIVGLLISIVWTAGAGILLFGDKTKDSEGLYTTWALTVEEDSHAVFIRPANFNMGFSEGSQSTFKVEASNSDESKQIFVGIADESDITTYLNGLEYDEITGLPLFPRRVIYQNHPGNDIPGDPASQEFWLQSASGPGTQILRWTLNTDGHSLMLMNGDGASVADMTIVIKTEAALEFMTGVGQTVIGIVVLLFSIMAISFSSKSRGGAFPKPLLTRPGN